jgi:hypothetical protein
VLPIQPIPTCWPPETSEAPDKIKPAGVKVYDALRTARPQQGVSDEAPLIFRHTRAHLLTVGDAVGCRIKKPAGVKVYDALRTACPQQGVGDKDAHIFHCTTYAFRYPVDKEGGASLEPHFRFNLFQFCRVLDGLFKALDNVICRAQVELRAARERAGR